LINSIQLLLFVLPCSRPYRPKNKNEKQLAFRFSVKNPELNEKGHCFSGKPGAQRKATKENEKQIVGYGGQTSLDLACFAANSCPKARPTPRSTTISLVSDGTKKKIALFHHHHHGPKLLATAPAYR
jgi:ribosomal protein L25 (general stress protein Ctc)